MMIKEIDLFTPIWWVVGIVLCANGLVSWWVFLLLVLSTVEFKLRFEK